MARSAHCMTSPQLYEQFKQRLRLRLAELFEDGSVEKPQGSLTREAITTQLRALVAALPRESRQTPLGPEDQERLIGELTDEIVGIGPLEGLLADPDVSEIMVNGPHQIYVEREGHLERTSCTFRDSGHLMSVIERLLDPAGVSVSEAEPCVDASLSDGTRINVIIPPLALNGPTVTIRKKLRHYTMEDWITLHSISPGAAAFLE